MRFRAGIHRIHTFTGLTASLSSLGNIAWVKLTDDDIRFTIIPEQGTQVWAVIQIDTIFNDTFTLESGLPKNAINLEVPLSHLHRALKSAQQNANASAASIRLTKKAGVPLLSLTITTSLGADDRDTVITQDIPVRVLSEASVAGLHEPMCREPDVHILLPDLARLKSISDRMTKLASRRKASPRLMLRANMHGCLSLGLDMDEYVIKSLWTGLTNPELDPEALAEGARAVEEHPSTRMKRVGDAQGLSEEGWATVRVEGRDWGKVLGVGRLGGRVIACFCDENALILYVYLSNDVDETESVITYYVGSYSA